MVVAAAEPGFDTVVAIALGALAAVAVALHATVHEGAHWLAARLLFGGRVKPHITVLPSLHFARPGRCLRHRSNPGGA